MNQKVTETIETLTLMLFQEAYTNFNVKQGGDINGAEQDALRYFKSIISLGNKARKEIVKEHMSIWLDRYEKTKGLESRTDKEKLMYIAARNEVTEDKINEILKVTKDIIKESWKQ